MGLLRLPNELILGISEWLDLRDVNCLLQTCRQFDILHEYLYRRDICDNNTSSLRWACHNSMLEDHACCYETARHAIDEGANVNMVWFMPRRHIGWRYVNKLGVLLVHVSPMLLAAFTDDTRMAQLLVEHGADINLEPARGFSPIIAAVGHDNNRMIEYLLQKNVDLRVTAVSGGGLLAEAARFADSTAVALLLAHFDDADDTGHSRITAVYQAASYGREDVLKVLLESKHLDLNRVGDASTGRTALTQACKKGFLSCVQLLCKDKRTDINLADGFGFSPVYTAISYHKWEIVLDLTTRGVCSSGGGNLL